MAPRRHIIPLERAGSVRPLWNLSHDLFWEGIEDRQSVGLKSAVSLRFEHHAVHVGVYESRFCPSRPQWFMRFSRSKTTNSQPPGRCFTRLTTALPSLPACHRLTLHELVDFDTLASGSA